MPDFSKVISDIRAKILSTSDRLDSLRERRRPFALDAVGGDKKARDAVAQLAAEEQAVQSEAATLALALEEAEKRQAEVKAEADRRAAAEEREKLIAEKNARWNSPEVQISLAQQQLDRKSGALRTARDDMRVAESALREAQGRLQVSHRALAAAPDAAEFKKSVARSKSEVEYYENQLKPAKAKLAAAEGEYRKASDAVARLAAQVDAMRKARAA